MNSFPISSYSTWQSLFIMKKTSVSIYLLLIGFVFIVFGFAYLFFPSLMIEQSGMQIPTPGSKADAWAMYAGLQIGFGAFLLVCAKEPHLRAAGFLSVAFIFGGIAIGRTLGVMYFQAGDLFNLSALSIEWPGALFALYLFHVK